MVMLSVEKVGCFHFRLMNPECRERFSGRYISEKIGLEEDVAEKFADFLNRVASAVWRRMK